MHSHDRPRTLVEVLRCRAARTPHLWLYKFLADGEREAVEITYGALERRAAAIGAVLDSARGQRALLLFPPGPEYALGFFGCLYGGCVAVTAYPPDPARLDRTLPRLRTVARDADASVVLTTSAIAHMGRLLASQAPELLDKRWIAVDEVVDDAPPSWQPPAVGPDDLALLQYTSGSTAAPKGVMISHANLLHNEALIQRAFENREGFVGVGWLPLFHDMGLIGNLIQPLYAGGSCVLLSPVDFLHKPLRWLQAISRFRASSSGGPGFAYDLCVRKTNDEQRRALDLSAWDVAFIGAEPVRHDTIERFSSAFAISGFRRRAFYPCYGLAEATLLVSGGRRQQPPVVRTVREAGLSQGWWEDDPAGRPLVSSGQRFCERIEIVDVDTQRRCPPGRIGEIWLQCPSVGQGYWNRSDETQRVFRACLADTGEGPFLRTGDLGVLRDGELFVTGRVKDLIIIRGRNHYPQDIEATVERCHEAIRSGCSAAFAVDVANEERLVVAAEVDPRRLAHAGDAHVPLLAAIRRAVAEHHGLQVHAVALLKPQSIPKTSSGKIQRHACRADFVAGCLDTLHMWNAKIEPGMHDAEDTTRHEGTAEIEDWLRRRVAAQAGMSCAEVDVEQQFVNFGIDSAGAVLIAADLAEWLGRSLPPTVIWDHPSIAALTRHIAGKSERIARPSPAAASGVPIAIVGMACRFPGASDPESFWQLLRDGEDAITTVPSQRQAIAHDGEPHLRWGGFLPDVDRFDADFFGISPREAAAMDPQQRLLLEVAWEALEHAGIPPERLSGSPTGVFVGMSTSDYAYLKRSSDPGSLSAHDGTGGALSVASGRLSYILDVRGPSLVVDTACSSSLVAVHLACQSLRSGECTAALAGGVNLILTPDLSVIFARAGMLAPGGRCRTFDATAEGYVRGEGCGMVVLKRLPDALASGDSVLAVIRGSAVNQDGRSNGLTAPNGLAQQSVVVAALQDAGLPPDDLDFVETHGTGTPLGDPIETHALGAVFGGRDPERPLWLGALKSNIGHLEAAAGIAGLLKVVLALSHGQIPPNLHFRTPNPRCGLEDSPLRIPVALQPWPAAARRRAGVSSFGFSGTNAHLIVEAAPPPEEPTTVGPERAPRLLALSARDHHALRELAGRYARRLERGDLADVCFSANTGRTHHAHRLAIIAQSCAVAQDQLAAVAAGRDPLAGVYRGQAPRQRPRIAFLFSGQGSQYAGMTRALFATHPRFRDALQRCDTLLSPALPLLDVLFGEQGSLRIDQTAYAQVAIFAVQHALVELWRSFGIEPDAVLGHSVGEFGAAWAAGVFSLEDALRTVAERGRLMQALPQDGAMLVVFAGEERIRQLVKSHAAEVDIAAVNGSENVVLSGTRDRVEALAAVLAASGVRTQPLTVSHAFHSPLMEPVLGPFERAAADVTYSAPRLPWIANLTGALAGREVCEPGYWRRHIREPVRFSAGMQTLHELGCQVFLEIGPTAALLPMARRCVAGDSAVWLTSLQRGKDDREQVLETLAAMYTHGVTPDWSGVDIGVRRRVVVPGYPFQRKPHWLAPAAAAQLPSAVGHPLLGAAVELAHPPLSQLFRLILDPQSVTYLRDHRIEQVSVFPAAGYIELFLAAALRGRRGSVTLATLGFPHALVVPENGAAVELQILLCPEDDGRCTLRLYARPGGTAAATWVLHASGYLQYGAEPALPAEPLNSIRERCRTEIEVSGFYEKCATRGNQWGPAFQRITRLWQGDGEALAQVRLVEADSYHLHPAVSDACVQALVSVLVTRGSGPIVGRAIARFQFFRPPDGTTLWSHAVLREVTDATIFVGDVRVFTEAGELIGEAVGVRMEALVAPVACAAGAYTWQWLPVERGVAATSSTLPGTWVLLADRDGVANALAGHLTAAGEHAVVVHPGADLCAMGDAGFAVTTKQPGARRSAADAAVDGGGCRGIVYLRGLDLTLEAGGGSDPAEATGLRDLLELVQALARRHSQPHPRLWVVTRGVHAVEGSIVSGLAQAPLWGLGRVIATEHPELWGGLIDLAPDTGPETRDRDAVALLSELRAYTGATQVALRAGRRFTPRLSPQLASSTWSRFQPDGCYVITGGYGALGLAIGRWMAEHGARRLILLGRTGLPPRVQWSEVPAGTRLASQIAAIRQIEALGASAHLVRADVADEEQLQSFLTRLTHEQRPRIRGVVHAAGVLADRPLRALDAAELNEVLRPKVLGAWLLHRLLANTPLDFFVLFSSVSSLLGPPGQASYAAANAFLDALASYRHGLGLPALSISWGPWAGDGMAAEAIQAGLPHGLFPLTSEDGVRLFGQMLGVSPPHVAAVKADWQLFAPHLAAGPALRPREPRHADDNSTPGGWQGTPALERHARITAYLQRNLGDILGMESLPDLHRSTNSLGLDSIMAIQLRNQMERDTGVLLPLAELLRGLTISELAERVEAQLAETSADMARSPASPSGRGPLSRSQQALWFLHQFSPKDTAYNVGEAVLIGQRLDVPALRRALARLVTRHAALRTTFADRDGVPEQVVHDHMAIDLTVRDAEALDECVWHDQLVAEIERPFDLETGPLVRVILYLRPSPQTALLLVLHHLIEDFWSLVILMRELGELYQEERGGAPAVLAPLTLSFADYVRSEQQMLAGPEGERHWAFWRERLRDAPMLDLPLDAPRPPVKTFAGACHAFTVDAETTRRIKKLCREQGATLYMALLATFYVQLQRYSGQDDLIVGSPVTTRTRAELAQVVGYFDNPLPLRVDLSGEPSFTTLLARVKETVLAAFEHQDFPFAEIVQRLKPTRAPNRTPLFESMFVLRKSHRSGDSSLAAFSLGVGGAKMTFGGLEIESIGLRRHVAQFDLTLALAEVADEIGAAWEYNTDLFSPATIARMADDFTALLRGIVAAPATSIRMLPLHEAASRPRPAYTGGLPVERLLHQLFEDQVERTPDAPAVITPTQRMSYAAVRAKARQVAHWLAQHGAAAGQLVGVVMEKGWEQVVATLGTLMTGAAFVPMDPRWPEQRLRYLFDHCQIRLALTQSRLEVRWPEGTVPLAVDELSSGAAPAPLASVHGPSDLAYVIFTSGSTGVPKGVMIEHGGAVNTILDVNRRFSIGPADRVLGVSALSFDLSIYDMFGLLAAGGAIVLPSASADPIDWVDQLVREHVTLWNSAPQLFSLLVEYAKQQRRDALRGLRLALLSGDWIPRALPAEAKELAPASQIISLGGATEASIWSVLHVIESVDPSWRSIPYGRAMTNQHVYVLDEALAPCPIGVAGELYIAGTGLARGYWGDPERTTRSFFAHPSTGERLYRTGDLGRYFPDGVIEFLGRADHQVKIRGFRVELGEIEKTAAQCPGIREVVVADREGRTGSKRLCAYLIADPEQRPTTEEVRRYLSERLPDYMVPSTFVFLDAFPLGPNGKLDRRALPAASDEAPREEPGRAVVAVPAASTERSAVEILTAIWRSVFRQPAVGLDDSFVALGGDSIQAIRICIQASQAGLRLRPHQIFELQTIARIATVVQRQLPSEPPAPHDGPDAGPGDQPFALAKLRPGQLDRILAKLGKQIAKPSDPTGGDCD